MIQRCAVIPFIGWIKHNNEFENAFVQIEAFISYLNESCFTGITDYEFHYSLYEKVTFTCNM
jgi:SM-20-related protein